MHAIPEYVRDQSHEELLAKVEGFRWYAKQLSIEPFATPTLGKIAVRFAKESEDESIRGVVKELATIVKQKPKARRTFNDWRGSTESWIGGNFGVLSLPTSLECDEEIAPKVRKNASSLFVAFGLALQALSKTRVADSLYKEKKGLLKALGRKKVQTAWGLDIGSTSLRAIKLELTTEKDVSERRVLVKEVYVKEFACPLSRAEVINKDEAIGKAVRDFVDSHEDLEESPVWINLSAKEIVNRFVCLPPVKNKEAAKMMDDEIEHQIPLDPNDLSIIQWIAPHDDEDVAIGRPAFIAAARSIVVDRRVEICEEAGLKVAGMQADTIALANFVAFEFAEELQAESGDENPPAIVLVDCGLTTTSAIVVTCRSTSISTFEVGGEDLTAMFARMTKKTLGEADELKKNPVLIDDPMTNFDAIEPRLEQLRQRLQMAFSQSDVKNHKYTVHSTWCVGRSALCLTWLRHVLTKK